MVREEELILLMSKVDQKTVQQNGLELFGGFYWNSAAQVNHFGEKLNLRYTESDITKVYVFDQEWKYIGIANRRRDAEWFMDDKDYAYHNRFAKAVKESVKAWEGSNLPMNRMTASEREELLSEEEIKEPKLKENFLRTKFAAVVAEEEKLEEERLRQERENDQFRQKFSTLDNKSYKAKIEDDIDNFLQNYGRSLND